MLIFDEKSQPIVLENIYTSLITDSFWVLDLNILDFKLAPLGILEQIDAPSFMVSIDGFEFPLPTNWNILVLDEESMVLDVVQLREAAGRSFKAFVYGPSHALPRSSEIIIKSYYPVFPNVGPALNKHQMLCHPVAPQSWICVSGSDTYNKYLKDKVVGDII